MYITDLVSYNLQVFAAIAITPVLKTIESIREFYYTKIKRMGVNDYHLMMLARNLSTDDRADAALFEYMAVYKSAQYLLGKVYPSRLVRELVVNFSPIAYLKGFAVDENIVTGWRMLQHLETLGDLIEMLVFLNYVNRTTIEQVLGGDRYGNRNHITIEDYYKAVVELVAVEDSYQDPRTTGRFA